MYGTTLDFSQMWNSLPPFGLFGAVWVKRTCMESWSGYCRIHSWTYRYAVRRPLQFAGIISKFPAILSIPSQNLPKSRDIRLFPPAAPSRCLLKLAPPTSGGSLAHVADGGLWMKYAAIRSYLSVLSLLQRAGAKRKGPHLQCWTTRCRCSGGGE